MVAVQQWLDEADSKAKLVMQVHDELVLEVPEAELEALTSNLRRLMQSVATLEVALIVDVGVGDNWDQAH
jgi:DNA polymerase I